ncbi:hypothetical protein [Actinokineospora globicatena]|uniref:hypothetical protein n=1 Tax=Actinokineospora globicatena TaxID=103729 RepID=UPI0020A499DD|nr:hypothetical protein [Actinokineospora globicatena]MCP2306314.1 hypothetical protein [Actinokineospora globicatena]GLW81740.1 hypothetical protein Aglo01_62210 [Actinokineospora globicatena]GLW88535.1 hypothetical protein Aglo02_61740 [Actinokineospora globicatena]
MSGRAAVAAHFRRTEGKLTLIAGVVLAAAVVAGLVGVLSIGQRADLLTDLAERRGSVNAAAGEVYRALADADATSFSVVLVNGEKVAAQQQAFRDDVVAASAALDYATKAVPEVTPTDRVNELTSQARRAYLATGGLTTSERLAVLSSLLPVYTGLVEAGWVYSSRVDPVGTSYLNEASLLLRDTMLELAKDLRDASPPAGVDSFPWFALAVGLSMVLLLVAVQRYLARRTRRRFNIGLVLATALTLVAFGWLTTASLVAAGNAAASARLSATRLVPLTEIRAEARNLDGAQARALIFPLVGDLDELTSRVTRIQDKLADVRAGQDDAVPLDTLGQHALDGAVVLVEQWPAAISRDYSASRPRYDEVAATITANEELKDELDGVIATAGRAVDQSIVDARSALSGTDVGVAVLMAVAGAAAVAGLWPRIAEYR